MTDILAQIHEIKHYVSAAGALAAIFFDRNLGPSEDDLPMKFKIILAAPILVAIYWAGMMTNTQRQDDLKFIFGSFVILLLIYMTIWSLFGY